MNKYILSFLIIILNAKNPYGLNSSEKHILKNQKKLNTLTSKVSDVKLLIDSLNKRIEGLESIYEGDSSKLNSTVLKMNEIMKKVDLSSDIATKNSTETEDTALSRLILDVATHKRSWQLWSLLCAAEPLAFNMSQADFSATTWLNHSRSAVTAPILIAQQTKQVLTYAEQPSEVALVIEASN